MCRLLMKTVLLALLLISPLAAEQEMKEFIVAVHDVIQGGKQEAMGDIAVKVPVDPQVIDRFFMPRGLKFRGCEVLLQAESRTKWKETVPALIDSLGDVRAEDQVMRIDWSDVPKGEGRITVVQYFVITKAGGRYKLRIK